MMTVGAGKRPATAPEVVPVTVFRGGVNQPTFRNYIPIYIDLKLALWSAPLQPDYDRICNSADCAH